MTKRNQEQIESIQRLNAITKETILEELKNGNNLTQIATKFKVKRNSLRYL